MASSPDRPSYEMSSEFIIEELDDALESMIYRWDFCLRENSKEASEKDCCRRIRALVFAGDPIACSFIKDTEIAGARIDFDQKRGKGRLACVSTAYKEYRKTGPQSYMDAIRILLEAWNAEGKRVSVYGHLRKGQV